jgi:hypothetical protein
MKKRYAWASILGIAGGYVFSKGESLASEPVFLGLLGGLVFGFVIGLLLEHRQRKKAERPS